MDANKVYQWQRDAYTISTDPALLDLNAMYAYLSRSYWSPGIPREVMERAVRHSLPFGLYDESAHRAQVGFARVVTDYASFAYLADVYVLSEYRGHGLGVWLIDCVLNCPALQSLRSFWLATRDAHALYSKFGFTNPIDPTRLMVKGFDAAWRDESLVAEPPDPSRVAGWLNKK